MVPKVLEVTKGDLCWIVGTVYMEMPLKPNILEDIGKDVSGQFGIGSIYWLTHCPVLRGSPSPSSKVPFFR